MSNNAPTVTMVPLTSVPAGGEVRVSTTDTSAFAVPTITRLADGGYIVTWSAFGTDGDNFGVFAQRYDAAGTAVGGEFRINSSTIGAQGASVIAALPGGGFVVAWQSNHVVASNNEIYAQRYDAAGVPQGGEVRVNTTLTNNQLGPAIGVLADGGYVIGWNGTLDGTSPNAGYHAQRFDAAGNPQGGEFRVNTTTAGQQLNNSNNAIAGMSDGGFVITWQSQNQDGSGYGVYARRYDAAGVALGGEFRVNSFTTGDQTTPGVVALSGGGFVVVWQSNGQDGSSFGIYAQRYDASGAALGGEFRVNSFTTGEQSTASLAALDDGGFVVTWHSMLLDGSNFGVFGQRFDASGAAVGDEFPVNTHTNDRQGDSSVVGLGDGSFVIVWNSFNQDGGSHIYSRHFENGFSTEQQSTLDLKGSILVDDLDSDSLTVTLTVAEGTLTVAAGSSGATVSGSGTGTVVVHGTLAQVQALLVSDPGSTVIYSRDGNAPPGSVELTVTVDDGIASVAETADIVIYAVNDAPVSNNLIPDIVHGIEDTAFTYTFPIGSFSDLNGDTLTYSATLDNGSPLPAWLSFDSATRTFSGMPPVNSHDSYSIRVTASDGSLTAFEIIGITIDSVPDMIEGTIGDDTLNGTTDDDRIIGHGGRDVITAGDGNDTIVLDAPIPNSPASTFAGGNGIDTLELNNWAANAYSAPNGSTTLVQLFPHSISSMERFHFNSQSGTALTVQIVIGQTASFGVTEVVGGDGVDTMIFVTTVAGTYTMPTLTRTNWTTSNSLIIPSDIVVLAANSGGPVLNYTFNASSGHSGVEALIGAAGNDILNGSAGLEYLDGRGGTNQLYGLGGNDALAIINSTPNVSNGVAGTTTTYTGAGSLYDGGDGTDYLVVGGDVDFQGTLVSIEGIYLQGAIVSTRVELASQVQAYFRLSGATLAALPSNLAVAGNGTIEVTLAPGDSFNGTGFTFGVGSNVTFAITGSSNADTIIGTAGNDVVDGAGGIDIIQFADIRSSYVAAMTESGAIGIAGASIGQDRFTNVELYRFADGDFVWDAGLNDLARVNEGVVFDGYLSGATVFIDVDDDGQFDAGDEPWAITDANGNFTLISNALGTWRAFGGVNVDTGVANQLTFSAPEGSGVINPLTTLVQALVDDGVDQATAEAQVKAVFGLDPSLDLTQFDMLAAPEGDPAALSAQKAAASIVVVLNSVLSAGGAPQEAQSAGLASLTDAVLSAAAADEPLDLTSTATLHDIFEEALPNTTTATIAALVTTTQAVTEAIEDATGIDDISDIQGNEAPIAANDSALVVEDLATAGNIGGNDSDADGDMLLVTGVSFGTTSVAAGGTLSGLYGTLVLQADGSYTYAADSDYLDTLHGVNGLKDVFVYSIADGHGGIASATLTIDVALAADERTYQGGNKASIIHGDQDGQNGAEDSIVGGNGADILYGEGGADNLRGGNGDDLLLGGQGRDMLFGENGNDRLDGGIGNDRLEGGKGDDRLTGGDGSDLFVFGKSGGADVITDFQLGVDHLQLVEGVTLKSSAFADVDHNGTMDLVLTLTGGSVTLLNVAAPINPEILF